MPTRNRLIAASRPLRHVAAFALLAASGGLAGCGQGILAHQGPIAESEMQLLIEAMVAMLLVVVPVIGLALVVAWWFRASNRRAIYQPLWSYSGKVEFTVWMIPLLIVMFLGTLAWVGAHDQDPYKPYRVPDSDRKPLKVEVVSLDWKWLFIYPTLGIATVNELVVPANTPIDLRLTSATVMNSFFVPGWAGQIYTMPSMQTRLSFLVSDPGESQGFSAHFSGDGFSDMLFRAISIPDDAFDSWVTTVKATQASLGREEYDALARRHQSETIMHYAEIDSGLFDYALSQAGTRSTPKTAAPHSATAHPNAYVQTTQSRPAGT